MEGLRGVAKGEWGSVLLGVLMLTFVLTLLGFALFDLASLESRLFVDTKAHNQAFEAAQGGLEAALYQLFLDFCRDARCNNPFTNPSWADGVIAGARWGPNAAEFASFPMPTNAFAGGKYTYTVKLKNLVANSKDRQDTGLPCTPDGSGLCTDLIYVRATGKFSVGTTTSTRTIEVLAQATNITLFGSGLVSGGSSGQAIAGNALIAGGVRTSGCGSPCGPALDMSGSAGVRNNYSGNGPDSAMPGPIQALVPLLGLVSYEGNSVPKSVPRKSVESLGVKVRVAQPTTQPAVTLSGTATLGTATAVENPSTKNLGKPTLDGVFVAHGCSTANCSNAVGGNRGALHVYSDIPIKSYDLPAAATVFPVLNDPATILGVNYLHYACTGPSGAINCNPDVTDDFFISHAFKVRSPTPVDKPGPSCPPKKAGDGPCDFFNILTAQGGEKWDDKTPSFTVTLSCATVACDDARGSRVNGSVNGSKPPAFQIAWTQCPACLLTIYQCAKADCTGTKGPLSESLPLPSPPQSVLPVLVYVDGAINICPGCNAQSFSYQGHAIFLAKGDIAVDAALLTPCSPCPDHDSFPRKHTLALFTPGKVTVGLTASNPTIMAIIYAGQRWSTTKQTISVGTVAAGSFDMGSQVPRFFQVPALSSRLVATLFPPEGPKWKLNAALWEEED